LRDAGKVKKAGVPLSGQVDSGNAYRSTPGMGRYIQNAAFLFNIGRTPSRRLFPARSFSRPNQQNSINPNPFLFGATIPFMVCSKNWLAYANFGGGQRIPKDIIRLK
jgi:hypothetical protein